MNHHTDTKHRREGQQRDKNEIRERDNRENRRPRQKNEERDTKTQYGDTGLEIRDNVKSQTKT